MRRLKTLCLLASVGSATAASMGAWSGSAAAPSGCTDISAVPVQYTITYGAAIQGLFDNFGAGACTDCHFTPPPTPSGNLDLSDGVSWGQLVDQPSSQAFSLIRVVPNHPEQSLLFQKINCDSPSVGSRMPLIGGPLSPDQQALIYDWIAAGAPVGTTDGIFRGTFDIRGFGQ